MGVVDPYPVAKDGSGSNKFCLAVLPPRTQ